MAGKGQCNWCEAEAVRYVVVKESPVTTAPACTSCANRLQGKYGVRLRATAATFPPKRKGKAL